MFASISFIVYEDANISWKKPGNILSFIISDYGFYKIEAKTKTANAVEFTSSGSSNHDSGKFAGSLETKYKWKDYGEYGVYSCYFIRNRRLVSAE